MGRSEGTHKRGEAQMQCGVLESRRSLLVADHPQEVPPLRLVLLGLNALRREAVDDAQHAAALCSAANVLPSKRASRQRPCSQVHDTRNKERDEPACGEEAGA